MILIFLVVNADLSWLGPKFIRVSSNRRLARIGLGRTSTGVDLDLLNQGRRNA